MCTCVFFCVLSVLLCVGVCSCLLLFDMVCHIFLIVFPCFVCMFVCSFARLFVCVCCVVFCFVFFFSLSLVFSSVSLSCVLHFSWCVLVYFCVLTCVVC